MRTTSFYIKQLFFVAFDAQCKSLKHENPNYEERIPTSKIGRAQRKAIQFTTNGATHMKYKLILVFSCLSIFGCGETIDARQLEIDNGLFYKKGDSDPFNGTAENFRPGYGNGVTFSKITPRDVAQCTAEFKEGELHGQLECFSRDDEKVSIIELREGKKHGKESVWDSSSGNLIYDVEFNEGAKDGYERTYDQSGKNLLIEEVFSDGEMKSSKKWNNAGELTQNITYTSEGATGFSVNNGGTENYYLAEKKILVSKEFRFKDGYEEPKWSSEMRYYRGMDGAYVAMIAVSTQEGYNTTLDMYDENGNLKDNDIPQFKSKRGLDESFIANLTPDTFD